VFLKSVEGICEKDQLKLLEALEEGRISTRFNGDKRAVKPRLICSSEKSLDRQFGTNGIRPSLAYRLDVIHIEIPPLRERKQEILPLADLFLQEFKVKYRKKITGFSSAVRKKLAQYSWPGNVRELRNAIEEAVILTPGSLVDNVNLT
jgi:DNA-binding NtrC family response regulator